MMKVASIILPILLILGLNTWTDTPKEKSIDDLLIPYQAAIDKVNAELDSTIYIPDKNKVKVYNNIKDMTPDEVERMLRDEYLIAPDTPYEYDNYMSESVMEEEFGPNLLPNFIGPIDAVPLEE